MSEATRAHVDDARERLAAAVEDLMSEEAYVAWLRAQARFHRYSWSNTLLIRAQCPEASYVKGFKGWLQMGRVVRKGERAIRIYAPRPYKKEDDEGNVIKAGTSFGTAAIFDISQTEALPDHPNPFTGAERPSSGAVAEGDPVVCGALSAALVELLAGSEVSVKIEVDALLAHSPTAGGYYAPATNTIVIRPDTPAEELATLIHEAGHALTYRDCESYAVGEVVVESVAFIVCDYFGIEALAPSSEYVAAWLSRDAAAFKKGLSLISRTAGALIDALAGASAPATT